MSPGREARSQHGDWASAPVPGDGAARGEAYHHHQHRADGRQGDPSSAIKRRLGPLLFSSMFTRNRQTETKGRNAFSIKCLLSSLASNMVP